ncbi:DUF642 domain-containing protein [Okeania sp. SIO1I7]|uniref:DUF642 domain-containing protein n=1 Tax=Okeania sp. SIO1I7 TaxID=2607772 RepID=UPI0013FB51B8|nr:DUF642 domain-containing protein [Okeania sp. SIO1I7]NET29428.1 DUF642 domain-containing protein [Okeania sp. SIO1I7]
MTNYRRIVVWVMSVLVALTCLNISPSKAIAAETNLVVNGSFEEPVVEYVSFENPIPGWDISESFAVEMRHPFTADAYDGEQFIELDGTTFFLNGLTRISQDLPTQEGQTYKLSFAFSPAPGVLDNKLNVYWQNELVVALDESGEGLSNNDWQVHDYCLEANSTNTTLSFDNLNETPDDQGSYLDAVSVVANSPECSPEKGNIIVSGDSNVINYALGTSNYTIVPGNKQFFTNILGSGDSVVIKQGFNSGSASHANQGIALSNFYKNLGASSKFITTPLNTGALTGVDLFISILPNNSFQSGELSEIGGLLNHGGTVLFVGEWSSFSSYNNNINSALEEMGSTMSIIGASLTGTARGSQIANHPFTADVSSFQYAAGSKVENGTALIYHTDNTSPIVAVEEISAE